MEGLNEKCDELVKEYEELKKIVQGDEEGKRGLKLLETKDKKYYKKYLGELEKIEKIYNKKDKEAVKDDEKEQIKILEEATKKMKYLKDVVEGRIESLEAGSKNFKTLTAPEGDDNAKDAEAREAKMKAAGENIRKYIKSKIGNSSYFKSKLAEYSENYKGEDESMPLSDMREIYGTKGALMMMCRLEDGSLASGFAKLKKIKYFSTYRRFCDQILKQYKALKVEAAITALQGGSVSIESFDENDRKELNKLLNELNKLEYKHKGLKRYAAPYVDEKFPLIDTEDEEFDFKKFILSTRSQIMRLKDTKGEENKKRKELINKVVRKIENIDVDSLDSDSVIEKQKYLKKYNAFIEKSGKLATTYLKTEGKAKINRFFRLKKDNWKTHFERNFSMDTCKIALMCLVAVCSKNQAHITQGLEWFKLNEPYLKLFVDKKVAS